MTGTLLVVYATLFGAVLGSFLNVCVYRWPRDESVVRPRSRCPRCERPIAWYDNIPVVSWLLLRGRCRHCGEPISVRYPLVELTVALIWGGLMWYAVRGGLDGWVPVFGALRNATFLTLLLGIALTDAEHYIIPDEFSLGGLALGFALSFLFVADGWGWVPGVIGPLASAAGAALGFVVLWGVASLGTMALRRGWIRGQELTETFGEDQPMQAMGGGDIKLIAMIGAFVGPAGVLLTIFLGSLAGSLVHVPMMLMNRRKPIPFGIYLAVGAAICALWGPALIDWYRTTVMGL